MGVFDLDGTMYHLQVAKGDVGRYVLLPGDPFRTDLIAAYLDDAKLVAHNREHKTWTGTLLGEKVSVTSTGMGCPSTAIAVEELIAAGADTFIRVGTSGRISDAAQDRSMVGGIVTGATRDEGTTTQYLPVEFPAIADRHLVAALADAADELGLYFGEGITFTKDALYAQVRPDMVPLADRMRERLEMYRQAGVLVSEMESAAIFVISAIRGCRASGVMAFSDVDDQAAGVDAAIRVACGAVERLIVADRAAAAAQRTA